MPFRLKKYAFHALIVCGAYSMALPACAQGLGDLFDSIKDGFSERSFIAPASSMLPNVQAGDYVRVDQSAEAKTAIKRGDVVVFKARSGAYFVKRVIGLPGEMVAFVYGKPEINGAQLIQKRIGPFDGDPGESWPTSNLPLTIVEEFGPEGESWRVLEAPLPTQLDNTGLFFVPDDAYFLVGDFRDNSVDSRVHSVVGYVQREQIVGVVIGVAPPR